MRRRSISAVLNAHCEGMLAKPSLESLRRAAAFTERAGHQVEIVAVLDRPDPLTRGIVETSVLPNMRIEEVDFGDLGMARSHGAAVARGRYVAFLDADDLWGVDWLSKAAEAAESRSGAIVWHPEVNVYFGEEKHLFLHVDMEDEAFRPAGLMLQNYWTALSFAERALYLEHPYPATDLREGFGFEDWAWNMRTIGRGVIHKIVPKTGHVIRRKGVRSLARQTIMAGAVPPPSRYLHRFISSDAPASSLPAAAEDCLVAAGE